VGRPPVVPSRAPVPGETRIDFMNLRFDRYFYG
jgi:hypothetical protein